MDIANNKADKFAHLIVKAEGITENLMDKLSQNLKGNKG